MSSFNDKLADAAIRMQAIEIQMFKEQLYVPGIKLARGSFYVNGPVCWQVQGAGKKYNAALREDSMPADMLAYCQEHQSK